MRMLTGVVMTGLPPGRLPTQQRQQELICFYCMQAHGTVAESSASGSGLRTLHGIDERRAGGWFNGQAQRQCVVVMARPYAAAAFPGHDQDKTCHNPTFSRYNAALPLHCMMQEIYLEEPRADELLSDTKAKPLSWFMSPPYRPDNATWLYLTKQRSKELWRLSLRFERLFDLSGDWFSGSRDQPEYVSVFRQRILAEADSSEQRVYVLRGQDAAVFTSVGGFLDCWPRLKLEEFQSYVVLPLNLSFYLRVHYIGSAHLAQRAA